MDISPLLTPLPYIVLFIGVMAAIHGICLLPIAASLTAIGILRRSRKPGIIGAWLLVIAITMLSLSYPFVVEFYALFL